MSGIEGTPSVRRTRRAGATPAVTKTGSFRRNKRSRVEEEEHDNAEHDDIDVEEQHEQQQQQQQLQLQQQAQQPLVEEVETGSGEEEPSSSSASSSHPSDNQSSPALSSALISSLSSSSSSSSSFPATSPPTSSFSSSAPHRESNGTSSTTRIFRVAEKEELQVLNQRLELYILKVREREASSGGLRSELDYLRQQHQNELDNLRKTMTERINEMKLQRDDQTKLNAELKLELKRMGDELARLTGELKNERALRADAEKRLRQALNDLQIAQDRVSRAENDRDRLGVELDALRKEVELSSQQLVKLEKDNTDAVGRASSAEQTAANAAADLALLKKAKEAEVANLTQQVQALTDKNLKIEDSLRREFGAQLKDILADRQQQYEEDKEQHLANLRDHYEELLNEKQAKIDAQQKEIEQLNQMLIQERQLRDKENRDHREFIIQRETLEKHIHHLTNERDQARQNFEKSVNEKNEQARDHQKVIKQKDKDFRDLMDVKVALDMEIAQYRQLIENEEDRLGLQTTKSSAEKKGIGKRNK